MSVKRSVLVIGAVFMAGFILALTGPGRRAAAESIHFISLDPSETFSATPTFAGASKSAAVTVNAYDGRLPFFTGVFASHLGDNDPQAQGSTTLNLGGKRLVIEYLSADITSDTAFAIKATLQIR